MIKNKSYIGISFIVLLFGIWTIKELRERASKSDLFTVGPVPNFELTDQNNIKISNKTYLGKVYVVEFFFSTCTSICPIMNKNMIEIQNKFIENPNFGIASISIDPVHDTSEKLKEHAKLLGVTSQNWHFLTGNQEYIFSLANKGFNLYVGTNNKIQAGFEHSGLFALVDKNGKIRCRKDSSGNPTIYYDGLDKIGIKTIKEDIKILLEE